MTPALIELATRNVRSGAASDVWLPISSLREQLHALAEEPRFARARRAVQHEVPLFTCELQSELLNVTLPFTEDPDVWQKVWGATSLLLEEDALFVLPGHLGEGVSKGTALTSVLAKGDGAIPVQTPRRLEHVLHCG